MKTKHNNNEPSTRRKLSPRKAAKYVGLAIGAVILICILIFIFFSDTYINTYVKSRITKTVAKAYPEYSIKLGSMHYHIWNNRFECDSVTFESIDSSFLCSVGSFSVGGIGWMEILLHKNFTPNTISSTIIDAHKIVINFRKSQNELSIGTLHISVPDSELVTDSIKYFSLIGVEQFFKKSQFRQTRFSFDIPQIKINGLDCLSLIQGSTYHASSIVIHDLFAEILVNMDKPYDKNSPNPQMPNEALNQMKQIVKVDSLKITNGRLKYRERYAVRAKPGVITFNKVNVSISGIVNHTVHPDTAVIDAEGIFMNSGKMKLFMVIPLTAKVFSLRYSGSLSEMDLAALNVFLEAGEHRRINSGVLQSAIFNINVNDGYASGTLRAVYKNLSISVLNKNTGSAKGILDRISSFIGKTFIIRGNNQADGNGLVKLGKINFNRKPDDYFLQFLWFSLRTGVGNIVGF